MADLIDRIAGTDETRPKIPVHQFLGKMRLYAANVLTRAQAAADFDLQGDEATQATAVADAIDAAGPQIANKIVIVLKMEAVMFSVEDDSDTRYHNPDGTINKAQVRADAGF